jgi:hypothetical protein
MNLNQVKHEIEQLGRQPLTERMYPITSNWVPVTDVLAIINRFEKHWKSEEESKNNAEVTKLIDEMLGES